MDQENDDVSREPDSNTLVLSATVIASATVSRNASGPRRSTIPAIVNVFRGPGRRCVMNNATPRFYKKRKLKVENDKFSRNAYPVALEKFIEYPGSPMIKY